MEAKPNAAIKFKCDAKGSHLEAKPNNNDNSCSVWNETFFVNMIDAIQHQHRPNNLSKCLKVQLIKCSCA